MINKNIWEVNSTYLNVLNIYNKIKGNNSYFICQKNENYNDIDNNNNNEIKTLNELKYKIKENDSKIKVFGKNFVRIIKIISK